MNAVLAIKPSAGAVRRGQVVEMDEPIQTQVARLESDVQHIMTNVADIKVELRRTNDRIDRLDGRFVATDEKLTGKIDDSKKTLNEKIDDASKALNQKIDDASKTLNQKIDDVSKALNQKIDDVREQLTSKIDALAKELASAKMWAIGLYVGQSATLLFVMAKGFKWL
jgi:dsDNA-specific endonuclease/ATPase MutS2